MSLTKTEALHGWGHSLTADCITYRPEKRRDLTHILSEHTGTLLARGLGRSYGDAAIQPEGTIRTERLNHFIEFDSATGIMRAQAGVTLAEIMDLFIPQGFLPPVVPGTRHVTLGGAFASNVHGKNHFREGDFAEHVTAIRLTLASGNTIECSPAEQPEIFWATAGGMGMTGIIEDVSLKLKPITSTSLKTTTYRVTGVLDMLSAFEHHRRDADYMIGWIDHMAKGEALGQGIFESAVHEAEGAPLKDFKNRKPRLCVPCRLPGFLLNRYSMALYNKRRLRRHTTQPTGGTAAFSQFFHPLDSIENWNRLYGRRGFFQYECLLPESNEIGANIKALLDGIHRNDVFSFLAVLKYHRDGVGPMTFSKAGYSLALDFPNTARVRNFLPHLNEWVAKLGGRAYLAKDSVLTPDVFDTMYGPQAAQWRELIGDVDPHSRFSSLMSERLEWKKR